MVTLTDAINSIEDASEPILAGVFIVFGFIICLWGQRLFRYILFFIGFVGGTVLGYLFLSNFNAEFGDLKIHLLVSLGIGLFLGIICACVYKAAVFVTGAIGGMVLAQTIWQFVVNTNTLNLYNDLNNLSKNHINIVDIVWVSVIAIICGIIALKIISFVLKTVTSFLGAFLMANGAAYYMQTYWQHNDENLLSLMEFWDKPTNYEHITNYCHETCWISVAIWGVMFLAGLVHQYHLERKQKKLQNQLRPEYMPAQRYAAIN